ncbi:MAG: flavodoxin [Candidatus Aminicenantes bacterium 4484_214]|nr:MAG: flavodoxin [Candidatus Aminicenantes bacterium 4484_214]
MKALIVYYSRTGTTKKMAKLIAEEVRREGLEVDLKSVSEAKPEQLLDYDGIIMGSPTYYGSVASELKEFIDKSISIHGKLDGKIGAAFTSSASIGGGNESTILSILEAMLIHGMIIQGDPDSDHYGPVALEKIDKRCTSKCQRFAQRFAKLVKEMRS